MIITVTGKLGSGKTYWCVNYIIKKFFQWSNEVFDYVPINNVKIITNIDSLEIPHVDLQKEIAEKGLKNVFNVNYIEDGINYVFVIDEAQKIFDRKYFNPDVFYFFQTSRHKGVDILLITQDTYQLSKELQNLCEREVYAIQRSLRTKGLFLYKFKIGDETSKTQAVKFEKRIGNMYRSQDRDETQKISYVNIKYIIIAFVLLACFAGSIVLFKNLWSGGSFSTKKGKTGVAVSRTSKPVIGAKEIEYKGVKYIYEKETEQKNSQAEPLQKTTTEKTEGFLETRYPARKAIAEDKDHDAGYPETVIRKSRDGRTIELIEDGRMAGKITVLNKILPSKEKGKDER